MIRLLAVAGMLLALAQTAAAQSAIWDGFEIKKRFDGGKDEQEPAQFALVAPDGWDTRYVLVDVGVRLNLRSLQKGRSTSFLAPVVEYHHADPEPLRRQKAVHQLSPGMTFESYFDYSNGLMPMVVAKAAVGRNFIDDLYEGSASGFFTIYSGWKFGPGRAVTVGGRRIGRYVPSIGIEHYENLAIKSGSTPLAVAFSGSFLTGRVFVVWYPFNRQVKPGDIRFAVEADGNLRRRLGDSAEVEKTLRSLSAGATWYFVPQRIGLGLSGEFGRLPSANFVDQRRVVLALRVKMAPS